MKLNPQQAPLYGECVLTVCLDDEEVCWTEEEEREGGEAKAYYLLFSGSNQRHLTTTLRVNHVMLQAICPAHDAYEQVLVTLCLTRSNGQVDPRSQQCFTYVPDLALDMARFLLNDKAPQGAMLLDDHQVPLKECERLDLSLALALQHLTSSHRRMEPGTRGGPQTDGCADIAVVKGALTGTPSPTDTNVNATLDGSTVAHMGRGSVEHNDTSVDTEIHKSAHACTGVHTRAEMHIEPLSDHFIELENHIDLSQWGRQWTTLLHFAASRGLRRVALFLLRQPEAREALRQEEALGDTLAHLAERKGHHQLAGLLKRFEASLEGIQEESECRLRFYPGGRAFQCHPGLGTYTLTLPSRRETEKTGAGEGDRVAEERRRSESAYLVEEIEELRRLIWVHTEQKANLDCFALCNPAPVSEDLTLNPGLCDPAGEAWLHANGQPESQGAEEQAVAALENRCKVTVKLGCEQNPTVVGITPCITGSPRPIREEAAGRPTPAVNRHNVRNRKKQKRTLKSTGNNKSVTETLEKAINYSANITGSNSESLEILSPKEPIEEGKYTSPPKPELTQFPIVQLSRTSCKAGHTSSGKVAVVTSIAEKQEGGNSELGLETSPRKTASEELTAKQTDQNHLTRETCTQAECDLLPVFTTERKAKMGQGQSEDSQEPTRSNSSDCSPSLNHRGSPKPTAGMLWPDGGLTSAVGGSDELDPETSANTVWYQDESTDLPPANGVRLNSQRKDSLIQSIWYDDNVVNHNLTQSEIGQRGSTDHNERVVNYSQALDLNARDPLGHDPGFQVSASTLSQVSDSGKQPALSHVPCAQRQEASGTQRDKGGREEGEAERKERGADIGQQRKSVGDHRRRTYSGESCHRDEGERGSKQGVQETADKGRKKRRRNRGRRGVAEAKLSSSSSTESHILIDTQADADPGDPLYTEGTAGTQTSPAAHSVTGRAVSQSRCSSESVPREEADAGTMRLPGQTESTSSDCGRPSAADANMDSNVPELDLARLDSGSKKVTSSEGPESTEFPNVTVPTECESLIQPVELKSRVVNIENSTELLGTKDFSVAVDDDVVPTELLDFSFTNEQDSGHADTDESKQAFALAGLSEQSTFIASMGSINPLPMETFETKSKSVDQFKLKAAQLLESPETERGFMEDVQSKDAVEHSILLEEAADLSLLQKQEGRTDDAGKAHLGHCFGHTESPGDGPSENKTSEVKERETRENHEEMGEETRGAQIKERLVSEERLGGERAGYKESCMWNKEQREREEGINSRGEVHPTHTVKEQNKNCREGEHGSMEGDNALCYKEELAAAAVAIVTVAVASALAHVELSQRLSVGLAEGEVSEEPSSKEHSHIPSSVVASRDHKLLINGRLQSVSERQVTSDSHAELTTAAAGKDHASNELSDRDESSPLGDKASTAKEDQLGKASDFRPQALLCSKAQHDGELDLKKGTDSLCSAIIGTHCSEYDNLLQTDGILLIRQHTLTKQSGVLVQVDLNKSTQISPVNTVQVISEATTMENLCLDLDALAIEAISPVQANIKASRNLDEVLDIQLNSQSSTESDSQFCQDGPVPCPVVDTGQGDAIKLLDVFESAGNPELKDGKEDSSGEHNCSQYKEPLCNSQDQERSAGDPLVTHVQETECHEASGSQSTSSAGAPRELGSQTRRRGSEDVDSDENKGGIDNAGAAEEQGSRFESGKCCSGLPHSESQHKSPPMAVGPQDDQVSCSSLPHSESQHKSSPMAVGPQNDQAALEMSLPVSPGDSFSGTTSTDPLTPEVGTSQPTPETSVAATPLEVESGTFQRQDIHCALVDERDGVLEDNGGNWVSLDTVDGCKQMEGMRDGEETRRITALEEESCQGAHVQPPETIPDGPASPEIQRERETFYPVQPCPEPCVPPSTPLATVKDLGPSSHGERAEESVSVCALEGHAGAANDDGLERLTPNAELDDLVFKKPAEPVSRLEFRDKRVRSSWSSTDDSSTQGPPSVSSLPSQDTMSLGTGVVCAGVEGVGATVGEEAERNDHLPDNLVTSAVLGAAAARASIRSSVRSLSPLRRHSWEPGRSNAAGPPGDADPALRSSPGSLPVEVRRAKPPLHRRSMSWCPSNLPRPDQEHIDNRSYSLEGLEVEQTAGRTTCPRTGIYEREERPVTRVSRLDSQERGGGSLVSLTEEEQEGEASSIDSQNSHRVLSLQTSCPTISHHPTLTKSISMVAISQRETDANGRPRVKRRISFSLSISPLLPKTRSIFSIGSFSSDEEAEGGRFGPFSTTPGSLEYSICEEEPGPLRSDSEGRGGGGGGGVVGGTKVSRTFSYLRSKMSKKNKGSDKEKKGEKEREVKEKEKRPVNGHLFSPTSPSTVVVCHQCARPLLSKEVFLCTNCGAHVHKNCRENLLTCAKGKMKQQSLVPEAVPGSAVNLRNKSTSSASSISSSSSSSLSRDRWSTVTSPEDHMALPFPRRNPSILSFSTHSNLSKSISTSNIAGLDEVPLKGLKFLSQSTDNLHQGSKVNASTESLTDEGTEMMDSQLMGEFENDVKELEADSWSATVDKKFLKLHKKDEVKRQDVIYELYQTELHHVRTLRIMSEVYYKGIQKELQLDTHTLDKVFPVLDDLLDTHTHFLTLLLERRRTSMLEKRSPKSFLIQNIGDVLANQFSGCNADRMKKVYGKFCSRHYEAVNLYKELHAKDKRFQALIKRMMSSSIVRRLSIPECILLVTQRITKYPVLIQRILQHTKDTDEDHACVSQALRCVKELIAAVDSKVNEQEKKKRLKEVYSRTDSKSIMRMKSGQMFAREDLVRGRRLLHDGTLQLKNSAGRLKDVHAMLLSDVLVFLQEKDQKYVFASLDQRSTVISLQKLIVREVANEERGLFLITAGIERPEMVEVLASSKEERNTWMSIIQDAMHCIEKEEDEGVPSETEEDRRQQENRAKEMRELLRRKDEQIISLLEEKVHIFKDLCDCNSAPDDTSPPIRERMLFRATPDDVTKGEPIIKDALKEVESLHTLVNSGVGGAGVNTAISLTGGSVGPVCLPRRAETFGGFDSHQMNSSKSGEKEEGDDALDLRRTESDSVLKKGANTSLQMLLKRNNEQVQHSVGHLHDLLTSLQAVVVQQDSFIEDQRQALSERLVANPSSRHSSSSSSSLSSTSSSSRPSSLIEQEKQRSLERQRQEAASLQKQQAAHQEERRRREREWEARERGLSEREARLQAEEEEAARLHRALEEEREELHKRKEEYQRDLERLREAQRRLERDREAVRRETERIEGLRSEESGQLQKYQRTPSTTSEDSLRFHSSGSLDQEPRDASEQAKGVQLSSSAPTKEPFLRIGSKRMGKNFNPFSSSSSSSASKPQAGEKESQLPTRLLQLAKAKKDKKDKKKKGKGEREEIGQAAVMSEPQNDGEIFFC